MSVSLPVEQMTLEDKLLAMERLWDELCREESQVPMPAWQSEALDERERMISEGKARFSDWESAKARLSRETA